MGFRARLWAMDALVAAPPPADGTKSVKVRRKKKTARVAPVGAGEGGSALTMDAAAAQPVSPADGIKKKRLKKLKPLKSRLDESQKEALAAPPPPARASPVPAAATADPAQPPAGEPPSSPWWVPPFAPGGQADHGMAVVSDWSEAEAAAQQTEPRVHPNPRHARAHAAAAGERFPLRAPILSEDRPCLADLGVGVALYFETLWAYAWLCLALFCLNLPSLLVAFLANPVGAL